MKHSVKGLHKVVRKFETSCSTSLALKTDKVKRIAMFILGETFSQEVSLLQMSLYVLWFDTANLTHVGDKR